MRRQSVTKNKRYFQILSEKSDEYENEEKFCRSQVSWRKKCEILMDGKYNEKLN